MKSKVKLGLVGMAAAVLVLGSTPAFALGSEHNKLCQDSPTTFNMWFYQLFYC